MILPLNPASRKASAKEPPMSPTPKMETAVIPWRSCRAAHRKSHRAHLLHHVVVLLRRECLRAIAQRAVGIRRHFDNQPIRARRPRRARERRDHVAAARAMPRIAHHPKMRHLLHHPNRRYVHRLARISFEPADSALSIFKPAPPNP